LLRRAVIGLGNPGARYARTRHNVGFLVVDRLARAHGVALSERRHGALCGEISLAATTLLLVKPQVFMNRSGVAVAAFAQELGLAPSEVLVVHDDLDLPLARIKLKRDGGTAGHRGLESIVEQLESRDFARLRVGIGRPQAGQEVADFVLSPFDAAEEPLVERAVETAIVAVGAWSSLGIDAAMNAVNAPPAPPPGGLPS
jgi:PTH1 family peptidyl-tRNA hydrolase